ncbi:hypothetical protein G9A89_020637 [Geosiphon pyriformis]|nr:hypothetical protein G9A89_020637 [Geosiphon pyriformis]
MFNKEGNSNKFQIEAWTDEKEASKSLKKLNKPSKLLIEEIERAAQIEAALRKYNPEILDMINKEKSVEKTNKQMDNLFDINKDIADLEETTKDIKDSKSDIGHTKKKHGKEDGVDLQSVGGYIELFLMTTNSIANQMASQKKVLVRDIPLGISDKEVGAAMKEFGEVKKVQIKVAGK